MISQKRSYNPRLKSRKVIKNYKLESMNGSGIDKKCVHDGTCPQKGFTLSDVLEHNYEVFKTYSEEKKKNYWDTSLVSGLLDHLPAYVYDECKSRARDDNDYNFNELIYIKDLEKLNVTITDDEKKKYIKANNVLHFFRKGVLTYGETKKRYTELLHEINADISKSTWERKETKDLIIARDQLKHDIKLIDALKELCKYPLKNYLSISQKHTNPKCKFDDTGDDPNLPNVKPMHERYIDINTNEKGV